MPYYVHPKTEDVNPEIHASFAERKNAHEAVNSREAHTVSFLISEAEKIEWRRREWQRFRDGVYSLPPWVESLWRLWEPLDAVDQQYAEYTSIALHFAHTSLKTPGCVAYTPSDEHGYQDRQVTIKVGRYLEQFCTSWMSPETIASYVAQVKSYSSDLQIARTPADVVAVYRNGPESCMSHSVDDYQCGSHHPCEVYGDSDLGVAYLGSIGDVSARALVWPDRKLHSRIYGDTTLRTVLKNAGYTEEKMGHSYGVFDGAKIRAIKLGRNRYVMPYLDCTPDKGIVLDEDGKYFTIAPNEDGEWDTQNTDAYTGRNRYYCSRHNCDNYADEDGGYCESCFDDHVSCYRCGEDYFFDTDDLVSIGDDWYCTSCASRHHHECAHCSDDWYEVSPDSEYCEDCRDHVYRCEECDETTDGRDADDPDHDRCDSCYADHQQEDEDAETEDDDQLISPAVHPLNAYPTISDEITVYVGRQSDSVRPVSVTVIRLFGCLAVHRRAEDTTNDREFPPYVLTHVPSGLVVKRYQCLDEAYRYAELLTTPGIDWSHITEDGDPMRPVVSAILRTGELPSSLRTEVSCPAF